MAQIQVRPNESLDSALKRFKKVLEQSGILQEYKRHTHYEKPSERRRRQKLRRRAKK
ncbi:MAG: 30S ribosomal protein S21 [Armatimonadota bacterium]